MEEDDIANDDIYVEPGDSSNKYLDKNLNKRITEARDAGLVSEGFHTLASLTNNHKDIFWFRLETWGTIESYPYEDNFEPNEETCWGRAPLVFSSTK